MLVGRRRLGVLAVAMLPTLAPGQEVVRNDEALSSTRPEAWAMNYAAAATFMTGFGETPALAPWAWQVALELGHIPRLSASDQRVGFYGTKQEDLNKSPVFGRVRALGGLPGGFVGEIAYTPPIRIRDSRAKDLFAIALGRRLVEGGGYSLAARAFLQDGRVEGDITCPARLAGAPLADNPFGCREASNDRVGLDYYGMDATGTWRAGGWRAHATVGVVRTDLEVRVDALTFDVRDRSVLSARATKGYLAFGAACEPAPRWTLAAEVLHVPLKVQRESGGSTRRDPFTGLRLQLAYRLD